METKTTLTKHQRGIVLNLLRKVPKKDGDTVIYAHHRTCECDAYEHYVLVYIYNYKNSSKIIKIYDLNEPATITPRGYLERRILEQLEYDIIDNYIV